jgi:hypothetical protein
MAPVGIMECAYAMMDTMEAIAPVPQSPALLFMKKTSLTISQHFNMQNIVTCAPKSVMKIIVVVQKIQVRIHLRFEFSVGHSKFDFQTHNFGG